MNSNKLNTNSTKVLGQYLGDVLLSVPGNESLILTMDSSEDPHPIKQGTGIYCGSIMARHENSLHNPALESPGNNSQIRQ